MSLWYTETFDDKVRFALKVKKTLHSSVSTFQRVELFDTELMGKTLALDGIFQTSEGDEFYYHEMIAHPALCCVESPKRVLVIGGGDGGTAREILRHPRVEECVMVEIDQQVVDACKKHIPHFGAWDDPRLKLIIGDGVKHIADAPGQSYDVVVLDNSDPVGPSEGLFGESFYQNVAACLRPGGVFALQSESPLLMPKIFAEIQQALGNHFTKVHPYFGPVLIYGASQWSWTFASQTVDPLLPNPGVVKEIEMSTRYYNSRIHQGAFALPNELAKQLQANSIA